MMKKAQANLFFFFLMGAGAILFFILAFPLLNQVIDSATSTMTNIFVIYMVRIIPYFLFIMIVWSIIYFAQSAGGSTQ